MFPAKFVYCNAFYQIACEIFVYYAYPPFICRFFPPVCSSFHTGREIPPQKKKLMERKLGETCKAIHDLVQEVNSCVDMLER